ncbi:ATP-binding cassette domain-containing protein (plasmid) [Sinorhizobium meliloti]|nr:ATP-binding cassette domain-containing protein [Sinorhizobium meliloti]
MTSWVRSVLAQAGVQGRDDVSFTLRRGETVGIVGESGSGKSSIARMLLETERADVGRSTLCREDIFKLKGRALDGFRRRVQMVFQDPFGSMNPRMNVRSIISEPWAIHRDICRADAGTTVSWSCWSLSAEGRSHAERHPHQFRAGSGNASPLPGHSPVNPS